MINDVFRAMLGTFNSSFVTWRRLGQGALLASLVISASCSNAPVLGSKPAPASAGKPRPSAPAPAPNTGKGGGINLVGNCDQKEIDGFEEQAKVTVSAGRVRQLTWRMKIGRKGTCEFDGENFKQTKVNPSIELVARDGSGCKLLLWSDPRRVTLAHSGCAKYCTPATVYDKAWPVMFDPTTGGCANNN